MKTAKFKSTVLCFMVVITVSLVALGQPLGAQYRCSDRAWQTSAASQQTDTAKHKVKKVRNRDLPYNSDAELYNSGSPASVMHDRSGTLNPGKDFKSHDKGQKGDTINIKGTQPNP